MSARDPLVWVNGERGAALDPRDRGLAFGDGLFETMRYGSSGLPLLDYHLRRLGTGASRLRIAYDADTLRSEVTSLMEAARAEIPQGVLKLVLTRGVGQRGYRVTPGLVPTRVVTASALPSNPPAWASEGVAVRFCDLRMGANPLLGGLKHLNRLEQVMARLEWDDPAIAEGLLADSRGRIVEGVSTNLFIVNGGRLLTPVIDTCGVAGVMRQYLIDRAPELLGMAVDVTGCERGMLAGARELFLCNAVIGVWPVSRLGDRALQVGTLTRKVRDHVEQFFGA